MWKKLLAAGCVVSLLATAPGMPVLADQIQEEKINIIGAEDSEQMAEPAGEVQEDATDEDDQSETYKPTYTVDMTNAANEEVVGEGDAVVGDGVTATFDEETGAVEFYSDGGTLWRNWTDELNVSRDDIKSIRVASGTVYLPANSGGYNDSDDWEYQLFCGLDNLEEFNSFGFNTSNVTNMSFMFAYCYKLVNLDLSSFNTSSVTDMHAMFKCCSSLTALNLSCLDTSNVTDMSFIFSDCYNLTDLDLSSLDMSNVTDMSYMFCACGRLTDLNMSGFDKLNVTNMRSMFSDCCDLINLDLSSLDTSNVREMSHMFSNCSNLTELDLSSFNTSNVMNMSCMFCACNSLMSLNLSNFDTSNVTSMSDMFSSCTSLTSLDLSSFDTSNVTGMAYMFWSCTSLTYLDLSSFDASKVTNMGYMFLDCRAMQVLKTPKKSILSVELPRMMYDDEGSEYEEIPVLSESIVLTRNKPAPKKDMSDCEITLSTSNYIYDGKKKEPTATVRNGDVVLTTGTDYTISYADNTDAGTALVKVTGKGNYKGEKSVTFTISKADAELVFAEDTVTKKTTDASFINALTKLTDGTVTFKSSNTNVATVNSTSGLVTIKGAGTAAITATAAEGKNYKAGSKEYSLTVKAPAPTPTPQPTVSGFSDVQDPNHAYYNAIYWAADAGITKGYSDGTFGINRSCTRGEMMMFLWRYEGKPAPKNVSTSPFKDVPKTHTFYKAILWGSQKGITKGYSDGTFGINRNVSRGECMMFLWRLKGKPAPKAAAKAPFSDVPKTHAFYNAVLWGYQKKITTGYTSGDKKGTFGINENCTRGQIVTFLYRAK